ncbi:MAG: DPP IV N-terminal domain-containing protein [Planctomycetes bacterium]|nr:DPP IV N-terminal domain-containing protein [Planctomycetota bacterium]
MLSLLLTFTLAADPMSQEWEKAETAYLKNIKQLTTGFVRAGEGYFSPDGKQIIYQAEEKATGNPFYQIFAQDLSTGSFRRVSPGNGRTTCAAFHPNGKKIIFASSHLDPEAKKHQEAEVAKRAEDLKKGVRRRYTWDFDPFMEIFEADPDGSNLKNLTNAKGYDAEGSFSTDGKQIVFCSNRDGHLNLYIMEADGGNVRQLTKTKDCYNGGPFFSPDGKKVIYRSDRKEKDRLQLYVINADGTGEKALTENDKWVYWAPYWYKDGKHIIYTAADHSDEKARPNYDLFWMNIETGKTTRITHAPGQDVLPVFSPDYSNVMWTSSRDGRSPTQLYIADFTPPKE